MKSKNIRNLASAIMLQATKEYCGLDPEPASKTSILRDLRSPWMNGLTDGMSVVVAERLEKHWREIKKRLKGELRDEN